MVQRNYFKLKNIILIALTGALAFIIMLLEFPLPFFPPFLRLDFSDVPALLTGFALGPVAGLGVVFMRNLLHLTVTATMGVGELANFLISGSLVATASLLYHLNNKIILNLLLASAVMVIVAVVVNLLLIIPLYEAVLDLPLEETLAAAQEINPAVDSLNSYLIMVIAPFNLMKAIAVSVLFWPIYQKISRSAIYQQFSLNNNGEL